MSRPTIDDFPGAPPWAYLTDEGWLVIHGEAWTVDEWHGWAGSAWRREHPPQPSWATWQPHHRKRGRPVGAPRKYATEEERLEAKRRSGRESMRRRREADRRARQQAAA